MMLLSLMKVSNESHMAFSIANCTTNLISSHSVTGLELKKTQSRAGNLEIELSNIKSERDAMKKRIDSMKKELDNQKTKVTEAEMLRLERDRLQIKLNELADIQVLLSSL